jgi:threonine dehydratase
MELVRLADIEAAAKRIVDLVRRTPTIEVAPRVFLKCESLQPGGAFKIRGASNMLARLDDRERAAGVITYSSGNHGQALAIAASRLGVRAEIVMPETAPRVKVDGVERAGATVIFAGTTLFDRRSRAEAEAAARGLTIVPPFDHPWIIEGQGTAGLEIVEQQPDVETVYVPIGGGGLISGVAAAVKGLKPSARVVGVEPAGAAKVTAALAAGGPVSLPSTSSIADGLLALRAGDLTFAHVRAHVDEVVIVDDEAIAAAVKWLFREARLVVEPSGATSVAAALARRSTGGPGVALVSGGNVDPAAFARYIA